MASRPHVAKEADSIATVAERGRSATRMSCMAQPIDRGLARMQRGGYRSTLRKRPFKRSCEAAVTRE